MLYGAGPLHLVVVLASLTLAAYTISLLGIAELWDGEVWWQSILVWFVGAVLLHDLFLFPVYALADRLLGRLLRRDGASTRPANVSLLNHIRVPALGVGLLTLLFLPGIIEQGGSSYANATGQTQDPFLVRWLLLSAALLGLSALAYGIRIIRTRKGLKESSPRSGKSADEPDIS